MLQKLGRWLRAAGYDTAIATNGADDLLLLAQAAAEDRILLTRDRRLLAAAPADLRACGVRAERTDAAAVELRDQLGVDWLMAPFTRCLVDNMALRPAAEHERTAMPLRARAVGGAVNICPACGRLYWPGSHVRRMQAKLARWAAAERV